MMTTRLLHCCTAWGGELRRLFFVALFSMLTLGAAAQGNSIKGNVVDAAGQPVIGASVLVKGTLNGANTDIDGNFILNDVPANATIEVSFVGYKTVEEVAVPSKTFYNITLVEDTATLDEVVVVGYGVQKKSDVTGATASVTAEDLVAMPVKNAIEGMQGKAAGVDVSSSERPGSVASLRIRGERSISASQGPLYVVDGIPLSSGGIEAINPQDIEKIDILKDASSTAIYGSRGANGVVLVTTKKGTNGRFNLSYSGTVTVSSIVNKAPSMNSDEYITYRREAYRTAGRYDEGSNGLIPNIPQDEIIFNATGDPTAWNNIMKGWANGTWDGSLVPTYDWTKDVEQTGITHEHTVSASGGSDRMQSYLSFGYLNQDGTQKGQSYERYTAKVGTDLTPTPWFKYGGSINATWSTQNYGYTGSGSRAANGVVAQANGMLPYTQPYDEDGNWIYLPGGETAIVNPIEEWKNVIDERTTLRALGSFYAQFDFGKMWKPLEGLRFRMNFGPDFREYRGGVYKYKTSILQGTGDPNAPGAKAEASANKSQAFSYTLDELLTYDRTFDKHTVGVTMLHSASINRNESYNLKAEGMAYDEQLWYNLGLGSNTLTGKGSNYSKTSMESYMVRLNYGFDSRYLLTVSGRWDGASQLAAGHKWDFFPSAAVAWRIDQEKFMSDVSWVDQLKIRLGYGVTGNAAIQAYGTTGPIVAINYPFGANYQSGFYPNDLNLKNPVEMANPQLGWEKTKQVNLGIDFSFFGNRLSGSLDLYTSHTTDLLLTRSILSVNGFSSTLANVGETKNKGLDLMINSRNIVTRDFFWNTDLTFSTSKDEIVELTYGKQDMINDGLFIGAPIKVAYDYKKVGIWQESEADLMKKYNDNGSVYTYQAGDVKVLDANNDGKIDTDDRVIIGQYTPKWTGGMTNTFNYKGFELSFFIYARWGFLMNGGAFDAQGRYGSRSLDYWTPENPTNAYPRPNFNNSGQPAHYDAMNYQDGSFIKMKNISFGYTFPAEMLRKTPFSAIKIYAQAMDPFMIYSKCDFMDGDYRSSIVNRNWVFGINLTF